MITNLHLKAFREVLEKSAYDNEPTDEQIKDWQNPTGKVPLYKPPKGLASSESEDVDKVANIDIGHNREVSPGAIGAIVMAPMVANQGVQAMKRTALNTFKDAELKALASKFVNTNIFDLLQESPALAKQSIKYKIPFLIGGGLLAAAGAEMGNLAGKGIEKAVFPYKKNK